MSAFQDFGYLSERRKAERAARRKKLLIIAAAVVAIVLVLAVVGAAAVHYNSNHPSHTSTSSELSTSSSSSSRHSRGSSASDNSSPSSSYSSSGSSSSSDSKKEIRVSSAIALICSPTDNRSSCETGLKKYVNTTSSPKDLVRAAVSIVVDEVGKGFNKSDAIESDDPSVKAAVKDCKVLHQYAKDELAETLDTIDATNMKALPDEVNDLKNWLSAVAAYQQTCIDGYPDGELKTKMQNAMKAAKEFTDHALAIVGRMSSFLTLLRMGGSGRRLLADKPAAPAVAKYGIPSWISKGDRRFLLSKNAKDFIPNVTVAKDGSGDFTTINDALAKIPSKYDGRYVIYVKEGVYEEQVVIEPRMINVTLFGDGSQKSVITGSKNYVDGVKTFNSATVAVVGDGFLAVAMGFQNTAGAIKHQAVALRVQSDRSIFLNCRMEGYQDTLYAHTHRQFYRGCLILGTIDFIFGDASAVFQNCILTVRRPLDNQQNIVLAQGRSLPHESTGFVIHNSRIVPDDDFAPEASKFPSYLGRPWQEYSHTIIMESDIGDFIKPDGYMPWSGDFGLNTLSYKEFNNKGVGADTSKRVKWPGVKVISKDEAVSYTPDPFIQGGDWIRKTNTPVRLGLFG